MKRGLVVAVALAVCAVLSGCDEDATGSPSEGQQPGQGASAERPEATYDITVEAGDHAVRVDYTWRNDSDQVWFAANRPADEHGRYDSGNVAVVGVDGGPTQLSQRVFAQPDGEWESFELVGATRVAPGKSVTGRLEVALPLKTHKPYADAYVAGEAEAPAEPDDLVFCLGVVPRPDLERGLIDDPQDGLLLSQEDTDEQSLFCSDPVDL